VDPDGLLIAQARFMTTRRWILPVIVMLIALGGARAWAQDAGTGTLASTDFTMTLSRVDSAGTATVLTSDQVAAYFTLARCACPTSVLVTLAISDTAAANVTGHTVDAQLIEGADCDVVGATGCTALGASLTLSSTKESSSQTLTTSQIFNAAAGTTACPTTATSSRLWAIVRLDGTRLATEPSLPLTLGGAGPLAPTAVKVTTADEGLLVSWTATGDGTTLTGHQVLCAPGPTTPSAPGYDSCPAATTPSPTTTDGGVSPFATLDAKLVCSGVVTIGTNSVRVHGLQNGQEYQIAVVAVGIDGTPSTPSTAATGTPGPTVGFEDLYKDNGGTAQTGCAVGGARARWPRGAALAIAVVLVVVARRRRRGVGTLLVFLVFASIEPRAAHAQMSDFEASLNAPIDDPMTASPRSWNFELRFGPYKPNVDSEFSERGSTARPYEDIFSSSRHLMTQVELDRQIVHRAGTWGLGVSAGYYSVSAAALTSDLTTRSGDQTSLRLIPLSLALVYRADTLRDRYHSPFVPYAKLGLDCTFWQASDTSKASATDGKTYGWHAAAGVAFDLSDLDPEAARSMDHESGLNETAVFFEVVRYSLDGFGSGSALHVGDTTWVAGLMLEM
jgi:hypothetical protein